MPDEAGLLHLRADPSEQRQAILDTPLVVFDT